MFRSLLAVGMLLLTLSACEQLPQCPEVQVQQTAISAGCLVVNAHKQLLVVEAFNGKVSIPGGSGEPDESAQCTAHRETWEETGLDVVPGELIRVMDNGFHVYDCQLSYQQAYLSPPFKLEIRKAFWLSVEDFTRVDWRFPEQKSLHEQWLIARDELAKERVQ